MHINNCNILLVESAGEIWFGKSEHNHNCKVWIDLVSFVSYLINPWFRESRPNQFGSVLTLKLGLTELNQVVVTRK